MTRTTLSAVVAAMLIPCAVFGQDKRLEQILAPHLYPPEMVMRQQRELELTDEQQVLIRARTQEFQADVLEPRWALETESQTLAAIVAGENVDVEAALEQMNVVLDLEERVKLAHLRLLVEIRNILNPSQQANMRRIMEALLQRREGEGASHTM